MMDSGSGINDSSANLSGLRCYHCNQSLAATELGRQDSCPQCGRDTHVCRNCMHYDRNFNNECRETQAERVVEKEKSNFCDWFKFRAGAGGSGSSRDSLKSAADALFGAKSKSDAPEETADDAKKAAEALFSKK